MSTQSNERAFGADTRVRTSQWGHWGITFSERTVDEYGRHSYAPAVIHGMLAFPVGVCGPADMPKRDEYTRAVRDWTERGVLPQFSSNQTSTQE